jgi:hypothetical protein
MRPDPNEIWWPLVLFCVFTLLSMGGAYWVAARLRSRVAGIWAAVVTGLFFLAVGYGVWALMRESGLA